MSAVRVNIAQVPGGSRRQAPHSREAGSIDPGRAGGALGVAPEDDDPSNKLTAVETQLQWLREIGFDQVDCHWKWRELALLPGLKR